MELEVRARSLVVVTVVLALAVASFLALAFRPSGSRDARNGVAAPAAATPAPTPTPTPRVRVVVEDRSAWTVHGLDVCLPKLRSWLEKRGYPPESVVLVVTDTVTPEMAVSTVWPDPQDAWPPTHRVTGVCTGDPQHPTCFLAVEKGEPGPVLDMIASVELANVLYDFYRPRKKDLVDENGRLKEWSWELFVPLIEQQEDGTWRSACITLSRR